jgi:Sulfotransferase family
MMMEASPPTSQHEEATTAVASEVPAASAGNGARAGRGALPNLVVIGAQKCATSGLHYYLSLHPEVWMSKPKELNFFLAERNWPRGVDWYRAHFDPVAKVRGESSPNYTAYPHHLGVPERMGEVVPDAKLIFLVRDPLDRIAAHWVHNYSKRREKGSVGDTLAHPNTTYLVRSQYHMQLQRFLAHYPRERLLVLEQEDLRDRRAETLRQVFEFAGVDPSFTHPHFESERHQTSRKMRATRLGVRLDRLSRTRRGRGLPRNFWLALDEKLPLRHPISKPDVRAALSPDSLRILREDAERLRELTGRELATWSIWDT